MHVLLSFSFVLAAAQGPQEAAKPFAPTIEPASDEPALVMKGFKLAEGFTIDCFAAEPRLAHPVCFWIARDGACYVAETFRHHAGVTDIRDHMDWLDDDVAARSVEDRVKMFKKFLGPDFATFETEHERVRLLRDTDGDGRIDFDTVFADGFHFAADGIAAGLLEHEGDVFYACIPNMWRLRDMDKDGVAEKHDVLSTGWGIRVALLGHDMHGLQIGPDGKLYWSIGDRGFRVETREGNLLDSPFTGAVLRSNLDGSELEVFATGLRNPQELAFDDYGNLWTGDNNSDGGDRARLVHVIEGGETGWRQAYQWLNDPVLRGPWNDERLWLPHFDGQAAYIVPPVANVANGPSGLTIDPGTGISRAYAGRLFLCDFTGSEASGVLALTVEPKGASFALTKNEHFIWGPLATDCDFGMDGGLYVSDWVAGWNKTGKGRIWRIFEEDVAKSPIVAKTRTILKSGMKQRSERELASLLGAPDRRVRMDAQLELGARSSGIDEFIRVARDDTQPLFARMHATWGLELVRRRTEAALRSTRDDDPVIRTLSALLADPLLEVRAQAARVAGNLRLMSCVGTFIGLLRDPSPRVRMYAAFGLARTRRERAVEPLLALIRETGESDPHLRHAATYALAYCATPQLLSSLLEDNSVHVRIAAVVALRRSFSPLVARFLDDKDWRVKAEAARAIYDAPIPDALGNLATMIDRAGFVAADVRVPTAADVNAFQAGNGYVRRVLAANFRGGAPENRAALARFAADATAAGSARAEALDYLTQWTNPTGRDPFCGEWMPLPAREVDGVRSDAAVLAMTLDDDAPDAVLRAWMRLVASTALVDAAPRIVAIARDPARDAAVRAAALKTLSALKADGALAVLKDTLFDPAPAVRAASIAAIRELAPDEALPILEKALTASIAERRVGYQGLAKLPGEHIDALLASELAALEHGERPPAIALDLVFAAEARAAEPLKAALSARSEVRKSDEKTARYLDSLYGGESARGREIFRSKAQLECLRCHVAESEGGVVGPSLQGLSKRSTRQTILESIVDPNRVFAQGFQGTVVFQVTGPPVEGTIVEDVADHVTLMKSDGTRVTIPRADIEGTKAGISSMPTNLHEHLSREEMRDLIEYLAQL
ncbi:MAG: PVC-type heme-binding CxxCH protein [Planctomycetota bacterium]|nr:PVC-type heme-binding CxxCH protein [Planctomycetota bacterium]